MYVRIIKSGQKKKVREIDMEHASEWITTATKIQRMEDR